MKRFTYLIVILLLSATGFSQGHFVVAFTGYGQDHMNIKVVTATIGGVALEAGDEIAAFDGIICCGKIVLTKPIVISDKSTFAALAASRKDDGLDNGYSAGNAISYKYWDSSMKMEIDGISAEYQNPATGQPTNDQTFTVNGSAFVKLSVSAQVNQIPTANAGPDQPVNEGETVSLDGSASSDPDGNPLTYKWTAPPGIILSSETDQKPTFTAPQVSADTQYTFSLVVNDGLADSPADEVLITVLQVNKLPVASAGSDQSVNEGATVLLDGSASSDPDGNPLTYKWTAPAGITLSSTTAAKPTFTAPGVMADTDFNFSLVVNDGYADSPADQVVISVKQTEQVPVANAGPNQTVTEGDLVTLDGSASSTPSDCPVNYQWPCPVEMGIGKTYVTRITFTGHELTPTTDHTITLEIEDGSAPSVQANAPKFQWVIPAGVTLSPKIIARVTIVAPVNPTDKKCIFSLEVFDGSNSVEPGNGGLTYVSIPPTEIPLVSITSIKLSVSSPEPTPAVGYKFSMLVYDGSGALTPENGAMTYFWIQPTDINLSSPTVARLTIIAPDGPADPNYDFSLTICNGSESPDPGNGSLTYRWIAPPGITLSSETDSKPTFTAPEVDIDMDYTFSLVVNNGKADSPPDLVVITVKHINKAPTANAGDDQTVPQGATVTLDGSASSDPEADALTYLWTAPGGINLSSATDAKPTFTAPNVAVDTEYTFFLVVSDGQLDSPADQVAVLILKENQAPVADAGTDESVNEGSSVSLDGSASSDPDGDALTYKWTAPAGIILSSETDAKPTFTAPLVIIDTDYTFSLTVNDGKTDSPADEVEIRVHNMDHPPYVKAPIKDVSVDKGSPDQIIDLKTVFADDDFGDVLIYSVISNTNDLVVEATISGSSLTLNFSDLNIGLSEIVITASSNGKEVNSKFTVEVNIATVINAISNDDEVQIYPNPTKGLVQLSFNHIPVSGSRITVYDLTGKIIYKSQVVNKIESLNLIGKPRGLYFIKIDQKTPKTYKLILE